MHVMKNIILIPLFFELNLAVLKSCINETYQPRICLKGKDGYKEPFPIILSTKLKLKEIIDINADKNSISCQVQMVSKWKDPLLGTSNGTNV